MTQLYDDQTKKEPTYNGANFALMSLMVACLAFALSSITPFVFPVDVQPVVLEEGVEAARVAMEIEEGVKEQNKKVAQGRDYWSLMVLCVALGAIGSAIIALLQKQNKYMIYSALCLGFLAIMAQYLYITLGLLLFIILIVGFLSALGVSF